MITSHYRPIQPLPFAHLTPPVRAVFLWLCGYYADELENACDRHHTHPEEVEWIESLRYAACAIRRGQGTVDDFEVARGLRRELPQGYEDGGIALCLLALEPGMRRTVSDATEGALFCEALRAVRPDDREWAAEELDRC